MFKYEKYLILGIKFKYIEIKSQSQEITFKPIELTLDFIKLKLNL